MDEGSCLSDHKLRAINTLFSEHISSMGSLSGGLGFVAMLLNLGTYIQMDEDTSSGMSLPPTASTLKWKHAMRRSIFRSNELELKLDPLKAIPKQSICEE